MAKKNKKNWLSAERRESGGFAAIPHRLLESPVFTALSAHAVKLLMDLAAQFKGFNNGDLCMAWTIMEKRGWKSRDTLNKARQELLDVELILVSRHGDRRRPTLFALTFFAIDECSGKLDVKPTDRPYSTWRLHEPFPPVKIAMTPPSGVSKTPDMTRQAGNPKPSMAGYDTTRVSERPITENL